MYGRARARTEADIQAADAAHVDAQTAICRALQAAEGAAHAGTARPPSLDPDATRALLAAYQASGSATAVGRLFGLPARSVRRIVQRETGQAPKSRPVFARRVALPEIPCEHCGTPFSPRDQKHCTCSQACSNARKNQRRALTSPVGRLRRVAVARRCA
jgi:hypothetical protein